MLKLTGALVATVVIASSISAQDKPTASGFANALVIAQEQVPAAQLIRARTEVRRGVQLYGFYFHYQGRVVEIEVNQKGIIVKNTAEDGDKVSSDIAQLIEQQKKGKKKLPEGRLLEIAGDALKNTGISEIQYLRQGDRLVIRVGDLVLDAQTGRPVTGN
jgi:uncharacterized membrane protein YkoI